MGRRIATPDAGSAVLRLDRRAAPRGTARSVTSLHTAVQVNQAAASVLGRNGRRLVLQEGRSRRAGRAARRNSTASATNASATTGRIMVALVRKLCVQKAGAQKGRATTALVRTASRATANRSTSGRARMSKARDRSTIAARIARATRQPRTRRAAPSGCTACTPWPPRWPIRGAGFAAWW